MKKRNKDAKPAQPKELRDCHNCENCLYQCEGDFTCDASTPSEIVISDFVPTDDFLWCAGRKWVKQ